MGTDFRHTHLWSNAFARPRPKHPAERKKLAAVFEEFRTRAATLGGEIPRDLPFFTVHDVTHLDALWEMADLVAGPEYPLTPAEVFVFGGAILVHDLAMSGAAFQGEYGKLKKELEWRDTVARLLSEKHNRPASSKEIDDPDPDTEKAAKLTLLRVLHARQAEALPLKEWESGGTRFYLIDSPEHRTAFARVIGLVAHSHHWPIDQLLDPKMLSQKPQGAPGWLPPEWKVDPVRLAALLRAADACHCDDRRAPAFLAALRQPSGISADHWRFQELYNRPHREEGEDRLRVSSKRPFTCDEIDSWWCGYDWVRGVTDRELRAVDGLLADTGRPRFAARGVWNTDDPTRFATDVPTDGWEPVDARIRVDDVGRLARMLGGEQLYGRVHPEVPLRELIQNAADAVRARRKRPGQRGYEGQIIVRLGEEPDGREWLEVEDDGVGMSARVLTGPLLDFGGAFWGTAAMRQEFPGLEAEGLEQTGQFGLGFFSVFMWGDRVEVLTRRYNTAASDAKVLEFRGGTTARPVLRPATSDECYQLASGGTIVRVWLKPGREAWDDLKGRLRGRKQRLTSLIDVCAYVAPALDVHLDAEANGVRRRSVSARDWLTLGGRAFFSRVRDRWDEAASTSTPSTYWRKLGQTLRVIYDTDQRPIGRATAWLRRGGAVVVGGFRSEVSWPPAFGIFCARATRASRDHADVIARKDALRLWAREQAKLDDANVFSPQARLGAAWTCSHLDEIGELPICFARSGGLSVKAFKRWVGKRKEFRALVTEGMSVDISSLADDVVYTLAITDTDPNFEVYLDRGGSLLQLLTTALCEVWGVGRTELARGGSTSQWLNKDEDEGPVSFDGMFLKFQRPTNLKRPLR